MMDQSEVLKRNIAKRGSIRSTVTKLIKKIDSEIKKEGDSKPEIVEDSLAALLPLQKCLIEFYKKRIIESYRIMAHFSIKYTVKKNNASFPVGIGKIVALIVPE